MSPYWPFRYLEIILCNALRVTQFHVGASCWDEILISFDRPGRFVMKVVRMFPRVVRDEKESVKDKASCVVDPTVGGDGAVARLRNQNVSDRTANIFSVKDLLHGRGSKDPPSIFLANTNKSPIGPTLLNSERQDHVALEKPQMVR